MDFSGDFVSLEMQGALAAEGIAAQKYNNKLQEMKNLNKPLEQKSSNNSFPKTREELHNDLIKKGYTVSPPSPNGYVVYKGPNGERVNIKPTGEVIPTRRVLVDPENKAWNAPKYNQRVYYDGTPVPDGAHTTGYFLEPFENK